MKLEEYQKPHVKRLIEVLKTKRGALDLSHTGTGKTVTGCAVVQKLDRPLAVVAPLAALPGWERTAKAFDLNFKAVNYESVTKKRGFVSASRIDIPKNAIVIYDEGHKCKNYKTQNAKTMLRVSRAGFKILTLSATLADHAEQLRAWNDAFRFSDAYSFSEFMHRCGYYYEKNRWGGSWLPRYENAIERTKRVIAPFSSIMIRPPGFKNQINVTVISSKEDKALAKLYEDTFKLLRSGDKKRDGDHLTRMLRARQASERAKIDYVIEKIVDLMAEGFSVPVFCNFNNTIDELAARLSGFNPAIIRGGQKPGERESERVRFQENKARVILCNSESGGIALDLHDVNGRPRYALHFPPLSGRTLKQGLGRIDRRGSLSDSTQEIIFSDVPAEVRVYEILKEKLSALDTLHDSEIDILGGVNV